MLEITNLIKGLNLNRSKEDILLDLIWINNKIRLYKGTLLFNSVREEIVKNRSNSYVSIKSLNKDIRLNEIRGFHYNRIDLSTLPAIDTFIFNPPSESFEVSNVLEQIHSKLNIRIAPEEVELIKLSEDKLLLKALKNNYLFINSVEITIGEIEEIFIVNTEYNEFNLLDKIDFTKTSKTLFSEMIEKYNKNRVLSKDYLVTQLKLNENLNSKLNSLVTLSPLNNKFSSIDIRYSRLFLTDVIKHPVTITLNTLPFSLHNQLDLINKALGIKLSKEEVKEVFTDKYVDSFDLEIKDNFTSLLWLSSKLKINVKFSKDIRFLRNGYPRRLANGSIRRYN